MANPDPFDLDAALDAQINFQPNQEAHFCFDCQELLHLCSETQLGYSSDFANVVTDGADTAMEMDFFDDDEINEIFNDLAELQETAPEPQTTTMADSSIGIYHCFPNPHIPLKGNSTTLLQKLLQYMGLSSQPIQL
jgi:hypothetical protein